ncbi:MAG: hypothetical protein RSC78_01865, partial [Acidaminococcaceae bacterium]
QSGSGKTIMTVEPKFVPADGVEIKIKENVSMKVRMVDCVGYIVDGVLGHEEEGKQRLVSKLIRWKCFLQLSTKRLLILWPTIKAKV